MCVVGDPQPITGVSMSQEVVLVVEPGAHDILSEYTENLWVAGKRWGFIHGHLEVDGVLATWVESPIGSSNAEIVINEFSKVGARCIVRMGTFGISNPDIDRGEVFIPTEAVSVCGVTRDYAPHKDVFSCSIRAFSALEGSLSRLGVPFRTGKVCTVDSFYGANACNEGGKLCPVTFGHYETEIFRVVSSLLPFVDGIDMETAAMYCIGESIGVDTLAVLCGSDYVPWRSGSEEEFDFEYAQKRLFRSTLRALPTLAREVMPRVGVG